MNFSVSDPELSLLRFSVRDQTGLLSSELVGQYSLAFGSMKRGEGGERAQEGPEDTGLRCHSVTRVVFLYAGIFSEMQ